MSQYRYEIKKILKNAEQEMLNLNHPYVGSEHLLLSLLQCENVTDICKSCNLTYDKFKEELIKVVGKSTKKSKVILYTPLLRMILDNANVIAKKRKEEVNEIILLCSILTTDDGIAVRILEYMDVDIEELYSILMSNNTNTLKELGVILNNKPSEILIGRDKEIDNIIKILLRKKKNNPLLIGPSGVGKSAIVYELARRIKEKEIVNQLKNAKIISIDMATLLSNTKYRGEFESRINSIIAELKNNKNIILFIDEIHTIVKSGSDNSIDAANMLKPYLASDEIKVIGATTIYEYEKYIESDKALARRFEKVYIDEPNTDQVINILKGVRKEYEDYHHIKISDKNIYDIVSLSNKYIFFNNNPDKSLDVLDYVCSKVNIDKQTFYNEIKCQEMLKKKDYKNALKYRIDKNKKIITTKDILEVIEDLSNVKILTKIDYENLVKALDDKIYGQDLTKLKNVLKKRFIVDKVLGITIEGEEGVGKSYTAKIIADTLKYHLIELDMNDYLETSSINKLIGVDPGYVGYKEKNILTEIKYHPFSLILIKNIDLAARNVISLFNRILKDGFIINKNNERIDFNNTLIIMTTNKISYNVGYTKNKKEDDRKNVIRYNLINKEAISKYLKDKELNLDMIDKFNEYHNFNDINTIVEDFIYTNQNSML